MLKKFAVTNYKGFNSRLEWDLSKTCDYDFNCFALRDSVVKNAIVFGLNGSGKTSLCMAVFDIVGHLTNRNLYNVSDTAIFPKSTNLNDPTVFEYLFAFGDAQLSYNYTTDTRGAILTENLSVENASGKELVFEKTADSLLVSKKFPIQKEWLDNFAENSNGISVLKFLLSTFPLPKDHYLSKLKAFVEQMMFFRCINESDSLGAGVSLANAEHFILQNGLIADFQQFLKELTDQDFAFSNVSGSDKSLTCTIGGDVESFANVASTGTLSLEYLFYSLQQLKKASFVMIDEFDAFYHFKLSRKVCEILFGENCQLYLTTHNTYLMSNELLRPDCYFIIGDNKIRSLYDCTEKDIRYEHNLEKLYRGGTFGL